MTETVEERQCCSTMNGIAKIAHSRDTFRIGDVLDEHFPRGREKRLKGVGGSFERSRLAVERVSRLARQRCYCRAVLAWLRSVGIG
ncbi:MAG: hypothetical protein V3U93_04490 [Alphaproteobacteria bacterium]